MKKYCIKMFPALLCIVLSLCTAAGCTKMTDDTYSWLSYWEEMQVPADEAADLTASQETSASDSNTAVGGESTGGSTGSSGSNQSESETTEQNPADKPTLKNTANLLQPFTTGSDTQAEAMRNKVLTSTDSLKVSGTTYYISYNGNDSNDGKTPATAWKTLTKLSYSATQLREGDAVLFERGGVYRGGITCVSGVKYGAYGSGDKPCIYRSKMNYATQSWTDAGNGLWIAPGNVTDAGIIVFNHGELAGKRYFSKSELSKNGDFYSEDGGKVYVYMDTDPAKKYSSIEIGGDSHIFMIPADAHDIVIDNITMKYGGAMGVQASSGATNITVTNCEIGWIGGSVLNGYGDGTVRYGNGIEFWNACENVTVKNNWIYQIYDSGFTHQGNGTAGFTVKNVLFTQNLVEYTAFGSIEYWAPAEGKHFMYNIEYSENILRFAGYGWGYQSGHPAAHIYSTDSFNYCENFVIKNNILDTARNRLIRCVHQSGTLPVLSGNTFMGKSGERIGSFGVSSASTTYFFDDAALQAIKSDWGDTTASVILN